jgi:hypothetical protein
VSREIRSVGDVKLALLHATNGGTARSALSAIACEVALY